MDSSGENVRFLNFIFTVRGQDAYRKKLSHRRLAA